MLISLNLETMDLRHQGILPSNDSCPISSRKTTSITVSGLCYMLKMESILTLSSSSSVIGYRIFG